MIPSQTAGWPERPISIGFGTQDDLVLNDLEPILFTEIKLYMH